MDYLEKLLDRASYAREAADKHPGDFWYMLGRAHGLEEAHALYLGMTVARDAS